MLKQDPNIQTIEQALEKLTGTEGEGDIEEAQANSGANKIQESGIEK